MYSGRIVKVYEWATWSVFLNFLIIVLNKGIRQAD